MTCVRAYRWAHERPGGVGPVYSQSWIIRAGHVLQTSSSSGNICFTSGDKRDQRGQRRVGTSGDNSVNVDWEASEDAYKEKTGLKGISVANSENRELG